MSRLTLEGAQDAIRVWSRSWVRESVQLYENNSPAPDPDGSYAIAYEAVFAPSDPSRARLEIWVTHGGYLALGFETWQRLGERLGFQTGSNRFVAGHEPLAVTAEYITAVLNLTAMAEIAVSATVLPLVGVTATRAVAAPEALAALRAAGPGNVEWVQRRPSTGNRFLRKLVTYEPW